MSGFTPYVPTLGLEQLSPFLVLLIGGLACLVADAVSDKAGSRRLLPVISIVSLVVTMATLLMPVLFLPKLPNDGLFLERSLIADQFGTLGALTILLASVAMVVMGVESVERRNLPSGEYYTLILFATLGMVLLAMSNELITAFISLEIVSLSLYVLTGIDRRSAKANEAAFKYFLLGAFASAFFVMGMAFLYGATGSTYLHEIGAVLAAGERPTMNGVPEAVNGVWTYLGFALLFVGICFKLSLAPFHMWAPDVYEGAPVATTMMIATGSKIGTFALLFHLLVSMTKWPPFVESAGFILMLVAVASMAWGNIAAVVQTNIKRMLAYSSIAHGGYLMLGYMVLAHLPQTELARNMSEMQGEVREAILLYLFGYTLMNLLAFGIAHYLGRAGEGDMKSYRGLWKREPWAAIGMALAMISLTGIPPTVGFVGKFYIFTQAMSQGFVAVAVFGMLMSVVSAYYYLRLVVTMFMAEEEVGQGALAGSDGTLVLASTRTTALAIGVAMSALILIVGVMPMIYLSFGRF